MLLRTFVNKTLCGYTFSFLLGMQGLFEKTLEKSLNFNSHEVFEVIRLEVEFLSCLITLCLTICERTESFPE